MTNPLRAINALGQSVWYDNLSRDLLKSGELSKMIEEDGVSGVTSNPTIFEKAIGSERIYDNDLHFLVDTGADVPAIYESLVVQDIRDAADLLMPTHEKTAGADGYVSLEVSPALAYDTNGTMAEVRRLFALVNRKNLMIKVPATPEGLFAVKELIGSGININITLIFSLEQYRNVAEAYIEGMEKWVSEGGDPRKVASVASFFVSRVDTMIDERLQEFADPNLKTIAPTLLGKAGTANAKLAYSLYKELFHGDRFAELKARGARPQRVLWASTSTKNPNYPDTYYVDNLLGPETVNTMPPVTLQAYRDHGQAVPHLQEGLDEARDLYPQLETLGIYVEDIMDRLLENGVKSFADSFEMLMEGIRTKRTRLLRGWGHRSASLGELQKPVDDILFQFDKDKVAEGIWAGDVSLWSDDPEKLSIISQRLGWLQAVETMMGEKQRLRDFADEIRSAGFTCAVLLGMGGSSLASDVFISCFGQADGYLDLRALDSTVPAAILDLERSVDLEHTLFIVSSKSGGTIEVLSLYKYFRSLMERLWGDEAGARFIAITDPGTSLGKLASEHGFRRVFLNPPDIGGRFSAISYFGLVPAALIGTDLDRLLMRASQSVEASGPEVPALENAGSWLGAIIAQASLAGRDKLSFIISGKIRSFGCWLEQLIAESTGKEGKGILPTDGTPIGDPGSYGRDRIFVYLRMDDDPTHDVDVSAIEQSGQPVITLRLHSPYDIGREIFRWEFATAVAGIVLKIDPFDQPDVQESKDITKRFLEIYKKEGRIPGGEHLKGDDPELASALREFMRPIKQGDYLAFNAFVRPNAGNLNILQGLRVAVRDRLKIATTAGFGPRYLHSTGQIHKGGPAEGFYVQITADDPEDVEIPGEAYSFGTLKSAQAQGDYEALKIKRRPIVRVHLASESDMWNLVEAFETALK
ncbi:MAG: bifunctional transaldolase/phosoglucose isomerase [Desulfomonilaceae bacterium]